MRLVPEADTVLRRLLPAELPQQETTVKGYDSGGGDDDVRGGVNAGVLVREDKGATHEEVMAYEMVVRL